MEVRNLPYPFLRGQPLKAQTRKMTPFIKSDHSSAIADHVKSTGHNIKWDHFSVRKNCFHCKIKETLLIQELKDVRAKIFQH